MDVRIHSCYSITTSVFNRRISYQMGPSKCVLHPLTQITGLMNEVWLLSSDTNRPINLSPWTAETIKPFFRTLIGCLAGNVTASLQPYFII